MYLVVILMRVNLLNHHEKMQETQGLLLQTCLFIVKGNNKNSTETFLHNLLVTCNNIESFLVFQGILH